MRTFLIGWVVAFCCVALAATGVGWYVERVAVPPVPTPRVASGGADGGAPFTEVDALEVVSRRLARGGGIDRVRQDLEKSAKISFHSAQHWRVCIDDACWVAHGQGRYAEPETDAARQRESQVQPPVRQ